MLSMVSSERHGADLRTGAAPTSEQFPRASGSVVEQQDAFAEHKSIPVPVLVKHEEYLSAEESYRYRYHLHDATDAANNNNNDTSNIINSNNNSGGGAESDTSSKARKEKRSTKSKCPPGLRSGKWTPEEEAFTNMIIHYFKRGLLNVEDGTSLRWYLAKRLNCEAMRVTKKLKGNSSIGKQIFRALEPTEENECAIAYAAEELAVVEALFFDSLASTALIPPPGGAIGTAGSGGSGRSKRSSPRKAIAGARSTAADAQKAAAASAQTGVRADSEDAQLLLHFFEGVHVPNAVETKPTASKKKRPASELDESSAVPSADALSRDDSAATTGESESSHSGAPPASKRHSVKITNLMD